MYVSECQGDLTGQDIQIFGVFKFILYGSLPQTEYQLKGTNHHLHSQSQGRDTEKMIL